MFALPGLNNLIVEKLPNLLDEPSLWCLFLFSREDKNILDKLACKWDLFSEKLGNQVHIITLLEVKKERYLGYRLRFPEGYDKQVGRFCEKLKVRLDELPAIILLNAADDRGSNYWPLRGVFGHDVCSAFETLVSDICEVTNASNVGQAAWHTQVATALFNKFSEKQLVRGAKKINIMQHLQTLVRFLNLA